jgi:hypothetical protein
MGVSARVQSVDVNLFSRHVRLIGLEVYDHRQNLLFDIGSLQTSVRSFSASHVHLGTTHIFDIIFQLHRYQEDSVSNLKQIINFFSASPSNQTEFQFRCSAIFLENGDLSYVDEHRSLGDTFQFVDFNNVFLTKVKLTAKNMDIVGSNVLANIENLSFKEHKGFDVSKFATRLNLCPSGIIARETRVTTPFSSLDLDLRFTSNSWADYKKFVSNVRVYAKFRNTNLFLKDLIYFVPKLEGMHNQFRFSGSVLGYVNHFQAKDFNLSYGRNTRFYGDILLSGLPNFNTAFFDLSINNLTTHPKDIDDFLLPNAEKIALHNELYKLGTTSLSGEISGYFFDLTASVDLISAVGTVQTDFKFSHDTITKIFDFSGHIDDSHLALGRLLNEKTLGNNLSLNGSFDGNFSPKMGIDLSVNIHCEDVEYQDRLIDAISIKGDWSDQLISALILIEDDDGNAEFSGELSIDPENLYLDVSGFFNNVDLLGLRIWNDTNQPLASSNFSAKIYSFNPDSLEGTANFTNLRLALKDTVFYLNDFSVSQQILPQGISTKIDCDFFKADVFGIYKFSKIDAIWNDIQSSYFSAFEQSAEEVESLLTVRKNSVKKDNSVNLHSDPQTLDLTLNVLKTGGLLSYFLPDIHLPNGADLKFGYNGKNNEHISLNIFTKNASAFNVYASHLNLTGSTKDSIFCVDMNVKSLYFKNVRYFEDISASSKLKDNFVSWQLQWVGMPNESTYLNGDFGGRMDVFSKDKISFNIQNSKLFFIDQFWQFDSNNSITIDSMGVHFQNVRFFNQSDSNEYLTLNGDLSRIPNSRLDLAFNRYQTRTWAPLIERIGLDFVGAISGEVNIFDFYNNLHFNSDLKIEDFSINQFNYGSAFLQTVANPETAESRISFDIQDQTLNNKPYLSAKGYFFPNRTDQNFDIRILIPELDMSFLKNYVNSFSSSLTGKIGGELTFDGSLRKPNLYGNLIPSDIVMKVDFLNAFYALTCEKIAFSLDSIVFLKANLEDMLYKTQSALRGGLYHSRFKQFRFDLNLDMNNFLALNTTQLDNEVFFGKAFTTGTARLGGAVENIFIDVQARTERGTEIKVNQTSRANISEDNRFVRFVTPKKDTGTADVHTPVPEMRTPANIIVRLNIDVTPEASFFFDMNIPPIAGLINALGSGNLRLNFESRGRAFTMFGDYVVQDGYYDFIFEDKSLGRLIERRFNIERGGNIQWTGDPANMILNLSAIYSTRANLDPVLSTSGFNSGGRQQKTSVQSVISIDGRMSQPNIKFDFRLPNVDETTRTQFFSLVNEGGGNEMIQQTFSLLLFGSFMAPGNNITIGTLGTSDVNVASMAWDALLGQFNNILQNASNNFNLGISYSPQDSYNTGQAQISMSTQFWDDRILLDGSYGRVGISKDAGVDAEQENVMDFNAEVRITDRFSFKAFHRPNDRDFLRPQSGYTQGIGVAYRRDFDSFKTLFSRRRKEQFTPSEESTPNSLQP